MSKRLPTRPNLQHLKKQAKQLLKSHRAGESEASARILACLPRFSGSDESQVRDAELSLAEAQSVIAREHGFESWSKLVREVERISLHTDTPHEQLLNRIAGLIEQDPAAVAALAVRRLATKPEDVAILMIALGQDTTGQVMKHLTEGEVERIAQSITELSVVTTEQEDGVLENFERELMARRYVEEGGMDYARGALEKAIGPRKTQAVLAPIEMEVLKERVERLIQERPQDMAPVLETLGAEIARRVEGITDEVRESLDEQERSTGGPEAETKVALEVFERLMVTLKYLDRGGVDYARGALEKALGPKKASALLEQARTIVNQTS